MRLAVALCTIAFAAHALGGGFVGETVTIPPAGGTFAFFSGKIGFSAPANTFTSNTEVSFVPNWTAPGNPQSISAPVVSIGRPWLSWSSVKPTLTIKYEPKNIPEGVAATSLRMCRLVDHRWTLVTSSVDTVGRSVSATLAAAGTYTLLATTATPVIENKLAFYFEKPTDDHIYSLTPTDEEVAILATLPRRQGEFLVAPGEDALYYLQKQPNGFYEFYTSNMDGSDPMRLTTLHIEEPTGGAISRDGKTIALSFLSGGTCKLVRMKSDGNSVSTLTFSTPIGHLAFNAAGTEIAYTDGSLIRTISMSAGNVVRTITTGGTDVADLVYNPAGTTIAFTMNKGGAATPRIFTVGVTGGTPVAKTVNGIYSNLSWSPTGTQIVAYVRNLSGFSFQEGLVAVPTSGAAPVPLYRGISAAIAIWR